MSVWFAVTMYVAMMLIPVGQERFTITVENKTAEVTRQPDGSWHCVKQGLDRKLAILRLQGSKLSLQAGNDRKEESLDLAEVITIPGDWAKTEKQVLKDANLGETVAIERADSSITLAQPSPGPFGQPVVIRWEKKP